MQTFWHKLLLKIWKVESADRQTVDYLVHSVQFFAFTNFFPTP